MAALVFIVSLGIYVSTLAPTVSFWDSGEYIACSYILGIPHPPGNPLYVLMGRIFTLFPFTEEVAVRVNFMSAFTTSLALMLIYIIMYRLVSRWDEKKDFFTQLPAHVGGVFAAFMAGFGFTVWMNAVEAEVYGFAVFMTLLISWLGLKWVDHHDTQMGKRIILLIGYLFILGFAIHQTIIVIIPAILLLIIVTNWKTLMDPKLWGWMVVLILFGWTIHFYLMIRTQANPGIDEADPHNWKMFWDYILRRQYRPYSFFKREATLAFQAGTFLKYTSWQYLNLGFLSRHFSNPAIIKRIVWAMVGIFGFLGGLFHFLKEIPEKLKESQKDRLKMEGFGLVALLILWTIVLIATISSGLTEKAIAASNYHGFFILLSVISLLALIYFMIRLIYISFKASDDEKYFLYLGLLVIITTVGTVLVMNLTNQEVRERDYFWSSGYMFWAMWMGMFVAYAIRWVMQNSMKLIAIALSVLFLVMPVITIYSHYFQHDRSNELVAHDYGLNILESCDPNAIIFTNGDNDTFPLWFLQEVKEVRTDVIVANLSLLNTPWYIKQLKSWGCPISFSESEIDGLRPARIGEEITHEVAGLPVKIPAQKIIQVKDIAVYDIINTNNWERPIYFAVTVADLVGFDEYLTLEGLVFNLKKRKVGNQISPQRLEKNIWDVYKYRGLTKDGTPMGEPATDVYKDENATKLISNYAAGFSRLASHYRRLAFTTRDSTKQREYRTKMVKQFEAAFNIAPHFAPLAQGLAVGYTELENHEKAIEYWNEYLEMEPNAVDAYQALSFSYNELGEFQKAIEFQQKYIMNRPNDPGGYAQLSNLYQENGQIEKAIETQQEYITNKPDDENGYAQLARLYADQENYEKMDETFERGIEATGDMRLYNNWRNVYEQKKMYAEAKRIAQKMLELSPDNADVKKKIEFYNRQINK